MFRYRIAPWFIRDALKQWFVEPFVVLRQAKHGETTTASLKRRHFLCSMCFGSL